MEKDKEKQNTFSTTLSASSSDIASNLRDSQTSKYQCGKEGRTGHGYVAEDINALADKAMGRDVQKIGMNNAKNGADRIVNGIKYQSKYCNSARNTVRAAFDPNTGQYKYILRNGRPMKLEVPSDQHEEAVKIMMKRIAEGRVKGVKNPDHAYKIVKKGLVTYDQAVSIAKTGKVGGIIYDVATGTVTATFSAGISAAITFYLYKKKGAKTIDALKAAGKQGAKSGGAVIGAQVAIGISDRILDHGVKSASKSVLATVAKSSARTNIITGAVLTAATSMGDINQARKGNITWSECGGRVAVNASSVAAGMAAAAKCAALAAPIPIPGSSIAAGFLGGMVASIGATSVGSAIKSKVSSFFKKKK